MVETPKEKVSFHGGFFLPSLFELTVSTSDTNVVDEPERVAEHLDALSANGHKALLLGKIVANVDRHVPAITQDSMTFHEDLVECIKILWVEGIDSTNTSGVIAVSQII